MVLCFVYDLLMGNVWYFVEMLVVELYVFLMRVQDLVLIDVYLLLIYIFGSGEVLVSICCLLIIYGYLLCGVVVSGLYYWGYNFVCVVDVIVVEYCVFVVVKLNKGGMVVDCVVVWCWLLYYVELVLFFLILCIGEFILWNVGQN